MTPKLKRRRITDTDRVNFVQKHNALVDMRGLLVRIVLYKEQTKGCMSSFLETWGLTWRKAVDAAIRSIRSESK